MPERYPRTMIRMPEEMRADLKALSLRSGIDEAELIRQGIALRLGKQYPSIARWPKEPENSTES